MTRQDITEQNSKVLKKVGQGLVLDLLSVQKDVNALVILIIEKKKTLENLSSLVLSSVTNTN